MNKEIKALYIHIPFCDHICKYCDFVKRVSNKQDDYMVALIKELTLRKEYLGHLESIYIGGGTPSCLKLSLLSSFLGELFKIIGNYSIKEITIEANPKDITTDFIKIVKHYNINRISLGIQSFNNQKLLDMGRNHDKLIAINALKLLKDFPNVNVDFIFGFPMSKGEDSFHIVKHDIDIALKYNVKHISCYSLILENKTILKYDYDHNKVKLLSDDKEANIYYKVQHYLEKKGLKCYEVSNFAYPGYESIHNLTYWDNNHYIGVGAAASYYIDNVRYTNTFDIAQYINEINNNGISNILYQEVNKLSLNNQMEEELMLGFRKAKGINIEIFRKKFEISIFDAFPRIKRAITEDYLKIVDNYLYISLNRLYIMNSIILYCIGDK